MNLGSGNGENGLIKKEILNEFFSGVFFMVNKYLELKKFTIPELKWELRDNFVSDLPNNKKREIYIFIEL